MISQQQKYKSWKTKDNFKFNFLTTIEKWSVSFPWIWDDLRDFTNIGPTSTAKF